MKSYLDFIKEKQFSNKVLNESFSGKNMPRVKTLIDDLLKKHITGLLPVAGTSTFVQDGKTLQSVIYIVGGKGGHARMFTINWDTNNTAKNWDEIYNTPYSISFYDNLDAMWMGRGNADLVLYTLGSSIVYFLPIIWSVASTRNYSLDQAAFAKIGNNELRKMANESFDYSIGALNYKVYENLSTKVIDDTYKYILEKDWGISDDLDAYRRAIKDKANDAFAHRKDSETARRANINIQKEYLDIINAIKGGAKTLDDLKVSMKTNVAVIAKLEEEAAKAEEKLTEERESPEEKFKKLRKYVDMVIKGINPSVILCGAPGVGKTYRVRKQLTISGYTEGINLITIKGKCTPRVLYMTLYEYKDKGDIIVIDDADGLVGPKAPEDSINILKGALDSTASDEGRLVNYGISGKLVDDEGYPIPKRFYYNGGVIVITNWNAGSLDSALKGRSFIQDIDFTTDEVLEILKGLIPTLGSESLSMESKTKAFGYLTTLANEGTDMEISIRTFVICAKIFESCKDDEDYTDEDAQSMIKEQMALQANRRKSKY